MDQARGFQSGLAGGGNKIRKLEYVVADAIEQGATVLVTTGGPQSNHMRQTAAAAAKVGMKVSLLLLLWILQKVLRRALQPLVLLCEALYHALHIIRLSLARSRFFDLTYSFILAVPSPSASPRPQLWSLLGPCLPFVGQHPAFLSPRRHDPPAVLESPTTILTFLFTVSFPRREAVLDPLRRFHSPTRRPWLRTLRFRDLRARKGTGHHL